MRRLVGLVLVGALALTSVGSPPSRAATVSSTWPVGAAPLGLALDDSAGKVYVANSGSSVFDISDPSAPARGLISVVDPTTGSVGRILTSLTSNFVVADSASRRLYSSNASPSGTSASLDVFDLDSAATVASLPGVGGLGLALDAAAGRLFAGGRELTMIDTATNTPVGTPLAAPAGAWFGVAVDAASKRLYLADGNEGAPRLYVYDYDSQDVLTAATPPTVALGTAIRFGLAVDPVRHLVFAAGSDTTGGAASAFYVIDPDTLQVVHSVALSGFPSGIALAPSANVIYVSVKTSETSGRVYVLDGATFVVTEIIPLSAIAPGLPLVHSDGRLYVGDYNRLRDSDSTLVALDPDNHAPVFQSFALTPSSPTTNEELHVDATATDPDLRSMGADDPTTLSYEWFRNGTLITGETGSTLDLRLAGNGDRSDTIAVRVTASDGQASSTATASVIVANSMPSVTVLLSSSSPRTNEVLTAAVVGTDADGDTLTYTYTWSVNGVVKRTTTTVGATDSFNLKVKGNGDRGDVVTVTVTASDGTATSTAATASATVR
jgi:DNA-binding beta-propeller fold protein YncE